MGLRSIQARPESRLCNRGAKMEYLAGTPGGCAVEILYLNALQRETRMEACPLLTLTYRLAQKRVR